MKPLVGWISGVHMDDLGKVSPKVINGKTGIFSDTQAVATHVPLPANQMAIVRILNLFRQGGGDVFTFPQAGFSVSNCQVNGKPANFAQYVQERGLDLSRPLVADYNGAQVNISFQTVDAEKGQVHFYARVFSGIEYKRPLQLATMWKSSRPWFQASTSMRTSLAIASSITCTASWRDRRLANSQAPSPLEKSVISS